MLASVLYIIVDHKFAWLAVGAEGDPEDIHAIVEVEFQFPDEDFQKTIHLALIRFSLFESFMKHWLNRQSTSFVVKSMSQ